MSVGRQLLMLISSIIVGCVVLVYSSNSLTLNVTRV